MRVKLLFLPSHPVDVNTGDAAVRCFLPPLGISTLTSFLRENNISVDQDDLNIKIVHAASKGKEVADLSVFHDKTHVQRLLDTGHDELMKAKAEKILRLTKLRKYDIVGLSIPEIDSPSSAAVALALGSLIKMRHGSTVVFGGYLDDEVMKKGLKAGCGDFIIQGTEDASGENNLLELCLAQDKGTGFSDVRCWEYSRGSLKFHEGRDTSEKERLRVTTPCFDGLPLDLYRRKKEVRMGPHALGFDGLILPYFFMRGCPYNCAFCGRSNEPGWSLKDPEQIVEDLERFSKKYRTTYFMFLNTLVNPSKKFVQKFTGEMIERDVQVKWTDCASFQNLDRESIERLAKAGAVRLVFGFESASERILRYIRKPFNVAQAAQVLKRAHELGIWNEIDLICGFPYGRKEDAETTLRFIDDNHRNIMSFNINKFRIDGRFKKYPKKFGISFRRKEDAIDRSWSTLPYQELEGLGEEDRMRLTNEVYVMIRAGLERHLISSPLIHELFVFVENPQFWDELKRSRQGS